VEDECSAAFSDPLVPRWLRVLQFNVDRVGIVNNRPRYTRGLRSDSNIKVLGHNK